MDWQSLLRGAGPPLLAALAAVGVDRLTERRGLLPPGFATPWRRLIASFLLSLVLWAGIFGPLATLGRASELDVSQLTEGQLFLLHGLLVAFLAAWYALGFAGLAAGGAGAGFAAQLGVRAARPALELGLGLAAGVAAWLAVILTLAAVAAVVWWIAGPDALPQKPPPIVPWIAGLPLGLRLLVCVSAGVVEEGFFRGFLQPRAGILIATVFFAMAHLAYEQPLMLVGITLLSLLFSGLVVWRQNILAAAAAHFTFDAIQLLVVIPLALRVLEGKLGGVPIAAGALAAAGLLLD
jgi:membrane protease YdiL (CAAX protease family)